MSKKESIKKKFEQFVKRLSDEDARKELVLAYLQMERCQQVLKGEDVEPVTMRDNGESSDLELFYLCKKVAEELAYLNGMVSDPDKDGKPFLEMSYDIVHKFNDNMFAIFKQFAKQRKDFEDNVLMPFLDGKKKDAFKMQFDKANNAIVFSELCGTESFSLSLDFLKKFVDDELRKLDEEKSARGFNCCGDVYYFRDTIRKTRVVRLVSDSGSGKTIVTLDDGSILTGFDGLFNTKEELIENLKKNINE